MKNKDLREAILYGFEKAKDLKAFKSDEFKFFKDYIEMNYPKLEKSKYKNYFIDTIEIFGDAGIDNIQRLLK